MSEVYSQPMTAATTATGQGIELEVVRRGTGRPILLLHGLQPIAPQARVLDLLARQAEIIAPSHPGFGRSPRPDEFDSVYDLVRCYLDVLDRLPHEKVTLLGLSFGGWLAAEIAVTLAGDHVRLREMRATLRERLEKSKVMDAAAFGAAMGAAYREMWRKWCGP